MTKRGRNDVEEVILQALGNGERRSILRIVRANSDGVTYSGILGETKLNTGHLNYHLRNLEGLIEKGDDRLYRLTPLGYKAVDLLDSLGREVDDRVIHYVDVAKGSQEASIHPALTGLFYIFVAASVLGLFYSVSVFYVLYGQGNTVGSIASAVAVVVIVVVLVALFRAFRTVPSFLKKLERRLTNK